MKANYIVRFHGNQINARFCIEERKNIMEERWYIKVGNCYVTFLGLFHEPTMKADYHKADPFLTQEEARSEANRRGLKDYKVVKKML